MAQIPQKAPHKTYGENESISLVPIYLEFLSRVAGGYVSPYLILFDLALASTLASLEYVVILS
jgi:hypothetical protein